MFKGNKEDEFTYNPIKRLSTAVVNTLDKKRFNPLFPLVISLFFYIAAGVYFATGDLIIGGLCVLVGGGFNLLNSQLSRKRGVSVPADSFLISVIERYSEIFIFAGLLYRYVVIEDAWTSLVASFALIGTILVSYTGLRKEFKEQRITLGFMGRAERLIIVIIGALINHMVTALYIIAFFSNLDSIIRIAFIYKILRHKAA